MKNTELNNPVSLDDLHQQFATSGVYAIYCIDSDTYYIGQSNIVIKRLIDHFSSLDNNDHGNDVLQREYNKFGKASFLVDLIHDMPNSDDLERRRMETKEIQRYKMYRHRLYNKVASFIQTSIPKMAKPKSKETLYIGKKPDSKNKRASGITKSNYNPDYNEDIQIMETCVDCGCVGKLSFDIFSCDDRQLRCSVCTEKILNSWSVDFGKYERAQSARSSQSYFRWQLDKNKYVKEDLRNAVNRFVEKFNQVPSTIFVYVGYSGERSFNDINIKSRKVTPHLCIDIPIIT